MGNRCEEEEDEYFDALDGGCSVSDRGSDSSEFCALRLRTEEGILELDSLGYDVWTKCPESVAVRRARFFRSTGLLADRNFDLREDSFLFSGDENEVGNDLILKDGWKSGLESLISVVPCSTSSYSVGVNNLDGDDVVEYARDELFHDRKPGQLLIAAVDESQPANIEELRRISGTFLFDGPLSNRDKGAPLDNEQKLKKNWWKKFGASTCLSSGYHDFLMECNDLELIAGKKMRKVHTHSSGKKFKELTSLYVGQEFLAHEGAIWTLNFSTDGQYLASAGEDAIVRVWKVMEEDRSDKIDISDLDSCVYFAFSESSHFASLDVDKDSPKAKKRSPGSSCAILPLKLFQIAEKPYHEFHGHKREVLDLSWSSKEYLLSSSVDKTVRLWKLGNEQCLRVFSHNDYVTSVSFNPVDENYFISGSIDGKVRIWEMFGGKVIDYTDIREIVSAVCFRPGGKGAIVGTMTGNCLFYRIEDGHLELEVQVNLHGKKKSLGKRIMGFQFPPDDPGKVVVSSADSIIRVLSGHEIICKFKGFRSSGSHSSASFTPDGNHIISSTEDSSICLWNYANMGKSSSHGKKIRSSESFRSSNVSVALPWCGLRTTPAESPTQEPGIHGTYNDGQRNLQNLDEYLRRPPHSPADCFTMSHNFFLEFLPKGSATWPEERLSGTRPAVAPPTMSRSEYRLLKGACHTMSNSPHAWGLVTVAATLDGRIRAYHNFGLPSRTPTSRSLGKYICGRAAQQSAI
ncbi:hypothetical protein MLD38_039230 [Melastoma candidum]|uniref:Uncharacterized protein n=1 Tax=Melastoma candidum TaxID=119954 RepID=A0ACB9L2N0_9MYRT|nr:hypothetical protein MLD38_039230 [Melastoma candidum]